MKENGGATELEGTAMGNPSHRDEVCDRLRKNVRNNAIAKAMLIAQSGGNYITEMDIDTPTTTTMETTNTNEETQTTGKNNTEKGNQQKERNTKSNDSKHEEKQKGEEKINSENAEGWKIVGQTGLKRGGSNNNNNEQIKIKLMKIGKDSKERNLEKTEKTLTWILDNTGDLTAELTKELILTRDNTLSI